MKTIDFTIDRNDLKTLCIACQDDRRTGFDFSNWVSNTETAYEQYFDRQKKLNRETKTFSQWVNGQTLSLT